MIGVIAQGCAYAGMTVSAGISFPQLNRILRRGDYAGVSWMTWTVAVGSFALWCTYGVVRPIPAQIPGNAVSAAGSLLLIAAMIRRGLAALLPFLVLAALGVIAGIAFTVEGAQGIGWWAFGTSAVMRVPQLRLMRTSPSLAAFSRSSWVVNIAAAALWFTYGVLAQDAPVIGSATLNLGLATGIVLRADARVRARRSNGTSG